MLALVDADSLVYRCSWNKELEELELAIAELKQLFAGVEEKVFASRMRIYVKGNGNYRQQIFPQYKKHRTQPPQILPYLYKWLINSSDYNVIVAHGQEADDAISIEAWKRFRNKRKRDSYVVCSVDKDLIQIPGLHYDMYHTRDRTFYVGRKESEAFLCHQLLTGDRTDNIQGIRGIGDVTASRILEKERKLKKKKKLVLGAWASHSPTFWKKELQLCGQLIYIRREKDEEWNWKTWSAES